MAFREQLIITMAPSGAGKTYVRCAKFLATDFLINEKGVSYSNFPLSIDAFVNHLEGQIPEEEVRRRLQLIPFEVLQTWEAGESGPWEYFADIDYAGAHIQIDEAHLYIPEKKDVQLQWRNWLAAVRHGHGTVEFITQAPENLPPKVVKQAGMQIHLMDVQSMRDPFFKIENADWFELKAKITGRYVSYFMENIRKKMFGVYLTQTNKYHARDPKYFALYDSYNSVGNVKGTDHEIQHEYQQRSLINLLCWFYLRNFWTLSIRCTAAIAVCLFLYLLPGMPKKVLSGIHKKTKSKLEQVEKKSGVTPAIKRDRFGNVQNFPKPKLDEKAVKMLQAENVELHRAAAQHASDYIKLRAIHEGLLDRIVKAKQANDLIGMLFADKAVTLGGRVVKIGDVLNTIDGEKTIKGFNYESSKIQFDDGSDRWVTIGQRRVQDSADDANARTYEKTDQGTIRTGSGGRKRGSFETGRFNNGSGDRTTSVLGNQRDSSSIRRNNNSESRPTIYSSYVGPQQAAGGSGGDRSVKVPQHGTNQKR